MVSHYSVFYQHRIFYLGSILSEKIFIGKKDVGNDCRCRRFPPLWLRNGGGAKFGVHDTAAATMVNFLFFHLGHLTKDSYKYLQTTQMTRRLLFCLAGLFCLALLAIYAPHNPMPIDVNINRFGNRTMFVFHAVLGIAGMLLLSSGIQGNKAMEFLGRNSLMILLVHIPLWRMFSKYYYSLPVSGYQHLFLTFCSTFLLAILLVMLVNKYLPQLKGEFKYD